MSYRMQGIFCPSIRTSVHPASSQEARSQMPGPRRLKNVRTDIISPAFYRTSSLWGRCPAYQPSHQKTINHQKIKKSRTRVPMTIYCPWTTGSIYLFLSLTLYVCLSIFLVVTHDSIRGCVGPSVHWSVGPSVGRKRKFLVGQKRAKISNNEIGVLDDEAGRD